MFKKNNEQADFLCEFEWETCFYTAGTGTTGGSTKITQQHAVNKLDRPSHSWVFAVACFFQGRAGMVETQKHVGQDGPLF